MASLPDSAVVVPQPKSLAEAVDKELTCAICLSRFDSPKVLPCLHLYCKKCLEDLLKKSLGKEKERIVCPQCQERHPVPTQGIDGFKTYFTINNLLELLHVHEANESPKTVSILCESDLDKNVAEARCLDCPCYLCKSCSEMHRKQRFTKGHTIVTLSEIKRSDTKDGVKSLQHVQYCEEHKEEKLKMFCKTCKQVICRDCALVKHREHKYIFVDEARPETQDLLEKLVKDIQAKETEFVSHCKYVEKISTSNSSTVKLCEKEVNKTFDGLQTAIEERRAVVISQLHEIYNSQAKQTEIEASSLNLSLRRFRDSIQFTRQLLDNASDAEVMSMSTQAKETLENIKKMTWDETTVQPSLLRFKSDPKVIDTIKNLGVSTGRIEPHDIIFENIPKDVYVEEKLHFGVALTQEISETGYNASALVKVTNNCSSSEVPCAIETSGRNVWNVSCTPQDYGTHSIIAEVHGTTSNIKEVEVLQRIYEHVSEPKEPIPEPEPIVPMPVEVEACLPPTLPPKHGHSFRRIGSPLLKKKKKT